MPSSSQDLSDVMVEADDHEWMSFMKQVMIQLRVVASAY